MIPRQLTFTAKHFRIYLLKIKKPINFEIKSVLSSADYLNLKQGCIVKWAKKQVMFKFEELNDYFFLYGALYIIQT